LLPDKLLAFPIFKGTTEKLNKRLAERVVKINVGVYGVKQIPLTLPSKG
jgi:hypothetical protein